MILLSLVSLTAALLINVDAASKPLSMVDVFNYMTIAGNGGNGMMKNLLKYMPNWGIKDNMNFDPINTLFPKTGKHHMLCEAITEPCFSYDRSSPIGPYCWGTINGHNTHCCDASGSFQSPISIPRPQRTMYTHKRLRYLNSSITGKVENIGVYPEFFSTGGLPVMLEGVPGTDAGYIFDNVHIHSGVRGAYRQTENLLYGRSFHAEAHIVHHHSDFADVAEASKHVGGIAVVSIFLTNDKQRYNPTTNRALDTILNHLKDLIEFTEEEHVCRAENRRIKRTGIYSKLGVERACRENNPNYDADSPDGDPSNKCQLHKKARGCGDPIENVTFNPNDLLSSIPTYLTFEGGLTTPPCSESVIWIVAEHPAYISNKNIEYMNKLKSRIVNQTISDFGNLRPLHDPAERDVFRIIYGRYPPRREEDDERGDGRHDLRDDDDNYDDDDYYNDDYSNDDYYDDDYYYDDYDDDTDDDHKDDGRRDRGGGDDKGGRGKGDDRGGRDNGDNRTGRGNRNDRGRRGNGDDSGGRGNGNNRDGRGNGDSRDRNNGNGNGRENGGVRGNGNDRDGRRDNGNGGDNGTRRGNGDDRGGRRNEDRGENRRGKDDQERESEDGRRRRRRFNGRRRRRGRGDDKGDDKGDDN